MWTFGTGELALITALSLILLFGNQERTESFRLKLLVWFGGLLLIAVLEGVRNAR